MPRMTAGKRSELESFWRAHLEGWRGSDLNQREYCELHGLPLKRFGNWRAKLKHEEPASSGKRLYRRGGGLRHMSSHMTKELVPPPSGYIPSARSAPPGARRRFSEGDTKAAIRPYSMAVAPLSSFRKSINFVSMSRISYCQEI